jgi:integration host factor subunit alpha
MTLTKGQIVDSIYNNSDLNKTQAKRIMETLIETIKKTLESGEGVMITRFGKFCVKEKKQRKERNPETGKNRFTEQRRVVIFRCSPVLSNKLDGKR